MVKVSVSRSDAKARGIETRSPHFLRLYNTWDRLKNARSAALMALMAPDASMDPARRIE